MWWSNLPSWLKATSKVAALLVPIFAVIVGFGPAYDAAIKVMPFATHQEMEGLKLGSGSVSTD